jgi:DNA-binding NarL/FixJ family response regulator
MEPKEAAIATTGSTERLTVFIAEDDRAAANTLAELLVAQGDIEVVGTATSDGSAAEWLITQGGRADVLITDLLLLPGGSGFGVINHAKNAGGFGKVVVFSSFVTDAVAEKCIRFGADAVFRKSQLDELVAFVREQRPARS